MYRYAFLTNDIDFAKFVIDKLQGYEKYIDYTICIKHIYSLDMITLLLPKMTLHAGIFELLVSCSIDDNLANFIYILEFVNDTTYTTEEKIKVMRTVCSLSCKNNGVKIVKHIIDNYKIDNIRQLIQKNITNENTDDVTKFLISKLYD